MSFKITYQIYIGLLLLGCIILSTVYLTDLMFLYNEKRIFQVSFLLAGGILFLFTSSNIVKKWRHFLTSNCWWGVVAVFLFSVFSAASSTEPFYAAVEVSSYLLLFSLVLLIAYVVSNYEKATWIIIFGACLFVFLYAIKFGLGYYFHLNGFYDFPLWPGARFDHTLTGFSNVRFFNQVQVFTLPLVVGGSILTIRKNKFLGYFLAFLSTLWWMFLIQSAGRGIILSTLTAALLVLLLFREHSHRWLWYFIGALAAGYLIKLILFDFIPDPEHTKSILRGGSSRLTLWPKVFLESLNKPIIGHGPMAFASRQTDFFRGHPHNSILQLFYEFGYPVTLLILTGLFYGLRGWVKQTKSKLKETNKNTNEEKIIRISFSVALLGGLIYSLFSGVVVMPFSQLWLVIIIGSMVGLYAKDFGEVTPISFHKFGIYGFKFILLSAIIILTSVLIKDIPNLKEDEKQYIKKTAGNSFHPRFWQQGKIGYQHESIKKLEN